MFWNYNLIKSFNLQIEVVPCTPQGKEYTEHDDMFVDNPNELIGKDLHFMVKILGCRGLPSRFNVSIFLL